MSQSNEPIWQFTEARANLSDVFERAMVEPQVIQHRNGTQAVLVSREYFDANKPTLKRALLDSRGVGEQDDDPLEAALAKVRASGATVVSPRKGD